MFTPLDENTPNGLRIKIEDLLKTDARLVTETGELNYTKIHRMVDELDKEFIELLYKNDIAKDNFFKPVLKNKNFIFEQRKFLEFLDYSSSNNSYSKYLGKEIGLYFGDELLRDRGEVVLNFPYKDCVLEGGQSTEEGESVDYTFDHAVGEYKEGIVERGKVKNPKRREIFYNEVLARDEIDQLFAPKAFCNVVKYTKDGKEEVSHFERNEEGIIKDNLIIKGNNLIALHCLYKEFEKSIKLIYIDPPFNTGKDDFKYNDNFNHSSWLVFMKNRLEIAKDLLCDSGIICIHVGNEEAAYIQVLLDSIFSRDNYLNHITITTNAPSGFKATSSTIFSTSNHIFMYCKNKSCINLNKEYVPKGYDPAYKYIIDNPTDRHDKWTFSNINDIVAKKNGYPSFNKLKSNLSEQEVENLLLKFMDENKDFVFRTAAITGGAAEKRASTIEKSKNQRNTVFVHPNEDVENFYILNGEMLLFWKNTYKEIDGEPMPATVITDVWNDIGFTGIASEGDVVLKNGKKPEKLLKRILKICTNKGEGDIVLDYHLGSGTTAAVAHKMGCQYIGIEQLDYGENDSVIRLQNVINGDQSGISKSVNWNPQKKEEAGSFIYIELAKFNENAIEEITACNSYEELCELFTEFSQKYFLHYNFHINKFATRTIKEPQFIALPLKKQKEMFVRMLDLNQLYVNKCDMEDAKFGLSKNDIEITKDFYGDK